MNQTMTERPKRKLPSKPTEESIKLPRRWEDDEIRKLYDCLLEHGHKNFHMLKKCLPHRSLENIKTFIRTVYSTATKTSKGHQNLDFWISRLGAEVSPWKDSIQIAQVIKYLSVDGLLENHPLPEHCQGIDFRQAYRLIYQALMGYPIQPVNQQTTDFIMETVADLNNEIKKEADSIKILSEFLSKSDGNLNIKKESDTSFNEPVEKKPLKVYKRKKQKLLNTGEAPSLKIVIEESKTTKCNFESMKSFSVTVEGSDFSLPTIVDVPMLARKMDIDEENLLQSSSYNPFQIPSKWLEEPLYLNLKQKP